MTLQMNRLRTVILAVAMLLATALLVQAAKPAFSDGARKSVQAQKKAKQKAKQKARARQKARQRARRKARQARQRARLKARKAGLKFYVPPRKLPAAHGRLIWQRPAGGLVPLENAAVNRLVLYTSKSVSGKTVAVSGSVSFPKGKPPRGGWPLITWGHSTTGIADQCAPSRNRINGPVVEGVSYIDSVLNGWLAAGYAVARTDFQGLGTPGVHPYLVGRAAGRDMLDIVRAARQMGPKVSPRYLIGGHSQGGHAALFAAGLAERWVPELRLRGSAVYAPGSQLKTQAQALGAFQTPNQLTALATMLFRGMSEAYPSLKAAEMLSDQVLAFYEDTERQCLDRLSEPDSLGSIAPADFFRPGLDTTELYRILDRENPAVKTSQPVLLLQGSADTSTFQFLTDTLNGQLTGLGNTVDYRVYPGLDHWSVVDDAQPDVLRFFGERLPSGR